MAAWHTERVQFSLVALQQAHVSVILKNNLRPEVWRQLVHMHFQSCDIWFPKWLARRRAKAEGGEGEHNVARFHRVRRRSVGNSTRQGEVNRLALTQFDAVGARDVKVKKLPSL
jgi:hypothetical protein